LRSPPPRSSFSIYFDLRGSVQCFHLDLPNLMSQRHELQTNSHMLEVFHIRLSFTSRRSKEAGQLIQSSSGGEKCFLELVQKLLIAASQKSRDFHKNVDIFSFTLVKWIEECVPEDPFLNPELMKNNPWVEKGKCVIL
ncbi:hypothetical protein NFI96_030841, partial [Prochilodus magdalenae]